MEGCDICGWFNLITHYFIKYLNSLTLVGFRVSLVCLYKDSVQIKYTVPIELY